MKRTALTFAFASLFLVSSAQAIELTDFDILGPIGKGPAMPFRAKKTGLCGGENFCEIKFTKVPKKTIMIVESVMCFSIPVGEAEREGAEVVNKMTTVGLVPPSANPRIKVVTNAYMPFKAGDTPTVLVFGKDSTVADCSLTGRLLPAG